MLLSSVSKLVLRNVVPFRPVPLLGSLRSIHLAPINRAIFKIQDENDFKDKVLLNKNLVILDFYATWCGPCRLLTPRLENVIGSSTNKNLVDLAKVDVDELETLAAEYDVSSIPVVFAMKDGKVVDKFVGIRDEDQLQIFIDKALGK